MKQLLIRLSIIITVVGLAGYFLFSFFLSSSRRSKAGSEAVVVYFVDKEINQTSNEKIAVDIFFRPTPLDKKVSALALTLKYPNELLEYLPNESNPSTRCKAKLDTILFQNETTNQNFRSLSTTRNTLNQDNDLPSGISCFGTVYFKIKPNSINKPENKITLIKTDSCEAVGPDAAFEYKINTGNDNEIKINLINISSVTPIPTNVVPTSIVTPTHEPPLDTTKYVNLSFTNTQNIEVGKITNVNVYAEDVKDCFGYDVRLKYDSNKIEVIDQSPNKPGIELELVPSINSPPNFGKLDYLVKNEANNTLGTAWYAGTRLGQSAPLINGSGILFTFQIKGIRTGSTDLEFTKVDMATPRGEKIQNITQNTTLTIR